MPTLAQTTSFIKEAHKDQSYSNGPYFYHPFRVWYRLTTAAALSGVELDEDTQHAALLHDVVEDTIYTLDDLRHMGYSEDTLEMVDLLTKREGESLEKYAYRMTDGMKKPHPNFPHIKIFNPRACLVKLADNAENSNPLTMGNFSPEKVQRLKEKYSFMRGMIMSAMGMHNPTEFMENYVLGVKMEYLFDHDFFQELVELSL